MRLQKPIQTYLQIQMELLWKDGKKKTKNFTNKKKNRYVDFILFLSEKC